MYSIIYMMNKYSNLNERLVVPVLISIWIVWWYWGIVCVCVFVGVEMIGWDGLVC